MSQVQKGSILYANADGIKVYQQAQVSEDVVGRTIAGKKNQYFGWLKGARIGYATGRITTNAAGTFVECVVELGTWRKRVVDWVRENTTGYLKVEENSFYFFVGLPDEVVSDPKPAPKSPLKDDTDNGGGTDTDSPLNTILIVVVIVLAALVAYRAVSKPSKA